MEPFEVLVIALIFFVVYVLGYAVGYGKAVADEKAKRLQLHEQKRTGKAKYDDPGVGWPTAEGLRKARKQFPAHRRPHENTVRFSPALRAERLNDDLDAACGLQGRHGSGSGVKTWPHTKGERSETS